MSDFEVVSAENTQPDWRELMVEEFRRQLYSMTDEQIQDMKGDEPSDFPDLFLFYSELAALKQEVSLQSRSSKKSNADSLEMLTSLHADLQEQSSKLEKAVTDIKSQVPQARAEAEKKLLLEIIGLREAANNSINGLGEIPVARPWTRGLHKILVDQRTSLGMLLGKADDLLRRFDVVPVAAKGEAFNASAMRAVTAHSGSGRKPGTVVSILRQGYSRNEKILLIAEVEVEK